ncbi:MAG: protein kinase domain-containing protein [Planctomycetota bacterium]|jgi:serine/threonine-protein kinase
MTDESNQPMELTAELIDGELDVGLRAAFGQDEAITVGGATGIIETLERQLGVSSRILLRDEADSEPPILPTGGGDAASGLEVRRYELHGELARGGVGIVLKGRDVDLGREVAIKVLQDQHADRPAMIRRFVEEAQITGQLQHPGILPVYEMGLRADQRPYFTMKLIRGQTLASLLRDRSDVDDDAARMLTIFEHVCQTMAYAHARGVIHRDLKPTNVMVGAFGEIQIVDWGLAKVLPHGGVVDESRREAAAHAETGVQTLRTNQPGSQSIVGSIMGTPGYMAPEQARGNVDELDERVDVFALGGILCEILTGFPPFTGTSAEIIDASATGDLREASERLDACDADPALIDLARHCLEPSAANRPRSAQVVADAVTEHFASVQRRVHEAEVAAAEARVRAGEERRARRLTLALAATVLTGIAVAAVALLWFERDRSSRAAQQANQVNQALADASVLFGQAQVAPAGQSEPWTALAAADDQLRTLAAAPDLERGARDRVDAFLAQLDDARRDREMIERIEELVIYGATHEDAESWLWMERELRSAYRKYGLDVDTMPREQIAERISRSPLAPQLTNGLELWVATVFHLATWGANPYPVADMMGWVDTLLAADPDPYRMAVRRLLYDPDPARKKGELERLVSSPEFETALPTTLSWLASIHWRTGQIDQGVAVIRRALKLHPADPMLNFDCAYYLIAAERRAEAVRYLHRALALRPDAAGIWRSLGRELRELGELEGALEALDQSIVLQGDYAPSHVDRGVTLASLGRVEDAIAAHETAIVLQPGSALAHCQLGRALQQAGRLDEALRALRRGHELGTSLPHWPHPSGEWLAECESLIETRDGAD